MKYNVGDLFKVSYDTKSRGMHVWYLTSEDIADAIEFKKSKSKQAFHLKKENRSLTTLVQYYHNDDFYYLYKSEKVIKSFFGIVMGFFTYKSHYEYEITTIIFFDVNEMKFVEINPPAWMFEPLAMLKESALVV